MSGYCFASDTDQLLGDNFVTSKINVVTDNDSDGTFDYKDSCPSDPAKSSAGVCGCGTPDIDANNNGIIDCLTEQEAVNQFRRKVNSLLKEIKKIKIKKFDKQKKNRNAVKSLLKDITSFYQSNSGNISFISGSTSLKIKVKKVNSSSRKFVSKLEGFSKNRKAALKDISALISGLKS